MANWSASSPFAHCDLSYRYSIPQQPYTNPAYPHQSHPAGPSSIPLSSFQRVAAPRPPPRAPSMPAASFEAASTVQGTAENPLIPKRRRRTTPAELAILEHEFRANPRPGQAERARIADRLGMTARAVQVWYQNRRQKEKKENSSFSGSSSVTSSGSDPKDLDGVVLSFSSSPLPSPDLPLLPTTGGVPANPFSSLSPSSELYSGSIAGKENAHPPPPPAPRPAPQPLQSQQHSHTYHYSYPSGATAAQNVSTAAAAAAQTGSLSTPAVPSVYLHRPHNASIIAAKKHVRKRPLGSHAPLARTPSLPHVFDFPPSPPKPSSAKARAASARPAPSRKVSLNDVVARQQTLTSAAVELQRRASATGLFGHSRGETVAEARRRSSTPLSAVFSPAAGETMSQAGAAEEEDLEGPLAAPSSSAPAVQQTTPLSLSSMTPASKAKAKDDLLQHMESDPPSASSPQPLTRRRMAAHDAALAASTDEEEEAVQPAPDGGTGLVRPLLPARSLSTASAPAAFAFPPPAPLARTASFSGFAAAMPTSHALAARSLSLPNHGRAASAGPFSALSAAPSLEKAIERVSSHARAPGTSGGQACAVEALGRKRARIIENGPVGARSLSIGGGLGLELGTQRAPAKDKASKARPAKQPAQAQKRRRSSAATGPPTMSIEDEDNFEDSYDSMAELSFSSTSTAASVDSLATVADAPAGPGGYFALGAAAAKQGKQADDERECAELLLGLGGFF
ncbi:hypothetical protein JCM10213_002365 [Rhodosporidiobolus nylandii]